MIVRRQLISVLTIALTLWAHPGSIKGERWSRQVSNSEWIPLANPRSLQDGGIVSSSVEGNTAQLRPFELPSPLQQQYQQQLLQLQETQESIQKLLLLQQQLRAQQQLLQTQSYVPESFSSNEERNSALHQSTSANIQTHPQFGATDLLPPPPGDRPQPPEFPAQDFLNGNQQETGNFGYAGEQSKNENQSGAGEEKTRDYTSRQGGHYKNLSNQERENKNGEKNGPQVTHGSQDPQKNDEVEHEEEEEEVQLLYVPAETLAQREHQNQQKTQRVRNRKQYSAQQQQPQQLNQYQQNRAYQKQQQQQQQQIEEPESQGLEGSRPSSAQQAFAHQVLYQLQREQAEQTRIQKEEREKELARLNEEQKELDRQAKLHQELVAREEEAQRLKEQEIRRELERQEEEARQRELQRLREAKRRKELEEEAERKKEAERQAELERQKIAEIKAKEAKARQAEIDRLAALERQKEIEIQIALEQQREIERQQAEEEARARAQLVAQREALAAREEKEKLDRAEKYRVQQQQQQQQQQQHLTETTRPQSARLQKGKQRIRNREGENRSTKPSPNQPPLSVYMESTSPVVPPEDLKVSDVLSILKDAKSISVLDAVGPNSPQIFVGPTNLDPPPGYAKFDLPYLSAIDNNRVERKVDKLPFFVAPLSFKPPPGYAKIPFPAPHVGSVVINTLDNAIDEPPARIINNGENVRVKDELERVNSYPTPSLYSQDAFVATTTPRYQQSYVAGQSTLSPPSGTRYRHRQFFNNNNNNNNNNNERLPHPRINPSQYNENHHESTTRQFFLGDQELGHGTSSYDSLTVTTPLPPTNYQETNGEHNVDQELAFINRELGHRESSIGENFNPSDVAEDGRQIVNGENSEHLRLERPSHVLGETQDHRAPPQGPTQYSLPAELPRVSPQLPGLVNSLIEQNEFGLQNTASPPLTTTPLTTTTTSTTETPTTTIATYRSRGRQRGRIVPTRAPTTTTKTTDFSPTRSNSPSDRTRRPYSRSRIRQGPATTTQTYQETHYEPTKPRVTSATNENNHHSTNSAAETHSRRPTLRNQRYRGRVGSDRNAVQPEISQPTDNPLPIHNQESTSFASGTPKPSLQGPGASVPQNAAFQSPVTPLDEERPDAQPLQGISLHASEAPAFEQGLSTIREIEGLNYHSGFKSSSFGEASVDQNPVNGFNYRSQNENVLHRVPEAAIPTQQSPQQYTLSGFAGFDDPHQPKNSGEQIITHQAFDAHDQQTNIPSDNFQSPEFNREQIIKTQQPNDNFDFNDAITTIRPVNENDFSVTTETSEILPEVTTLRSPATTTPVITRHRLTTRLNQNAHRSHVDPVIQTRPTGSRDEFVRFSAVNQDRQQHSFRPHNQPSRSRLRSRNRAQVVQPAYSQPETDEEYVRIQRPATTTTTTTSTTTQAPRTFDVKEQQGQEIEYGFIRPPSFKPIHPVGDRIAPNVAPIYKPKYEQVQSDDSTNDEPVEVSTLPPQSLKNRQKYHLSNRRPLTRSTTTTSPYTPTSTTQRQEDLDVKSKPRNEEWNAPNRVRGRVRRPGKKRTTTTSTTTTSTTTTTESVLDSSNELPALDENYPQIIQGPPALPPPSPPSEQGLRRTLFDEELKSPDLATFSQNEGSHKRPQLNSFDQRDNLEFPRSDFVLNFGVGSEHEEANEEYDQTQLASTPQRKYNNLNRGGPVADVEGAESQWSTKLTLSSFQPSSLPNHVHRGTKNGPQERREKSDESFDIITAAPDLPTGHSDIVVNASYLGNKKRGGTDSQRREEVSVPVLQGRYFVESKNETARDKASDSDDGSQFWNKGRVADGLREFFGGIVEENTTEKKEQVEGDKSGLDSTVIDVDVASPSTTIAVDKVRDVAEVSSKETTDVEEPNATTTKRTVNNRRRRVRVRVRPADDFVTAESQHVGSAWNYLLHEKQSSYNRLGEKKEKTTTVAPTTSSSTEFTTVQSLLEELFDEIRKDSDSENAPVDRESSTPFSNVYDGKLEDSSTTTNSGLEMTLPSETETNPPAQSLLDRKPVNNKPFKNSNEKSNNKPSIELHRFRPIKQSPKTRWTPKIDEEANPEEIKVTTIKNSEIETSTSAHGLSDFMNDFFKSFEAQGEESTTETVTTRPEEEEVKAEIYREENNNGVTILPTEVEIVSEVAEAAEIGGSIAGERVEGTTGTPGKGMGEISGPRTTPEVTLSPEELTTTTTTTTTTEIPSVSATTASINGNVTTADQVSKVLRTSTTTEISHMTEICYRGRCVKTKSKKEVRRR